MKPKTENHNEPQTGRLMSVGVGPLVISKRLTDREPTFTIQTGLGEQPDNKYRVTTIELEAIRDGIDSLLEEHNS